MSAKHRKASKLAAKRTAVAATAVGATAAVGLMSAPAQAATTPPDYSKAISDYSHALDNFLNASNNVTNSAGSVWNPIASQTGGILPTFGSDFSKIDVTDIKNLPQLLKNIGNLNLPTGVPGVLPNVVLPGGGQFVLPVPTKLPGGDLLVTAGTTLDTILNLPVIENLTDELPALSQLIKNLEITQSKYSSFYDWKLLGMNGQTNFLNTFLQTPSGLALNLKAIPALANNPLLAGIVETALGITGVDIENVNLLPPGTLPQATVWVPQGDGTYNFPLGGKVGWWAAAPTAALKLPAWLPGTSGMTDTVISVPIYAAGAQLPLNLAAFGVTGASVLLPTANGVYSPVSATMTNLSSVLPFGLTNINITTGNYLGTNGINVNNGQNLVLLQNPLGIPLPLLYGLGGLNFGVDGAGITSPSLFGMKLFSDDLIQVGTKPGPNSAAGLIPPGLLPTDPMSQIITGVTSPLGVGSLTQLLGIDAFIKPVMTAFGPVYQAVSAVTLKPLSDFATSQYGPFINNSASSLLDFSKTLSQQTANLPGAPEQPALLASSNDTGAANTTVAKTSGAHDESTGGENALAMISRISGSGDSGNQGTGGQDAKDKDGSDTPAPIVTQPSAPETSAPAPAPAPDPDPAPSPAPEPSAPPAAEDPAPATPATDPVTASETPTESTTTVSAGADDNSTGNNDAGTTDAGTDKAA